MAAAAVAVTGAVLAPIGVPAAQAGDPTPTGDAYVPMSPCRIVDTRQAGGALGDREIRDFFVSGDLAFEDQGGRAGGCDIPIGVSAIEASVTAVDPDDSGFFRAWPPAEAMPNATFMNFDEGMDITNTGSIALNPTYLEEPGANDVGGLYQLRVRNFGGSSHYVIDVQGYWIDPSMADEPTFYTAITPCRALDTRQVAEPDYIVEDRDTLPLNFTTPSSYELQGGKAGGCGIPYEAVGLETAVSAVDPEGSGFTRAWPANSSPPNATFLNYDTGMDITNTASLAIDPFTGPPSQATTSDLNPIELYLRNFGSSTHYVMDIQGYFTPIPTDEGATTAAQTPTSGYVPITP
ncbi:MAG: hypothetical protein KDA97_11940, partial [Acidimicrobiales bacterium]|nr:hypothetical protein [Acidimicrobiales bacterium]